MPSELRLADPGEGIHEVEILEIHVSAGDVVADGDDLFTVESDKAVTEVPAPFEGRIVDIPVSVGDVVEVGSVLLTYDSGDPAEEDAQAEEQAAGEAGDATDGGSESDEGDDRGEEGEAATEESRGTGNGERETPDDDDEPARSEAEPSEPAPAPAADSTFVADSRPVPASPATRALAKRLGVDLHEIEGSGPDGRIEPEDVQAATHERDEGEGAVEGDSDDFGPVERVPLRGVRRATAKSMATSWGQIPHVTHHDVADITGLEAFRQTYADEVEEAGGKLTLTVFLVKAAIAALEEHPRFNASLEDDALAIKHYHNIGVAVDTEAGLVVPVIRDAASKSMIDLAVELVEVAERMRSGDRRPEDFRGGTFTITNPGGIGGTSFEPIINHPEVAILGAARARQEPVIRDDDPDGEPVVVSRLRLPLVLAFDHRVNDGADAARFMNSVVALLEDFPQFLLHG